MNINQAHERYSNSKKEVTTANDFFAAIPEGARCVVETSGMIHVYPTTRKADGGTSYYVPEIEVNEDTSFFWNHGHIMDMITVEALMDIFKRRKYAQAEHKLKMKHSKEKMKLIMKHETKTKTKTKTDGLPF